tara:strand:+ start:347 stop:475 length:129 start_codon:yes stop_codon:yes gene_type:complete
VTYFLGDGLEVISSEEFPFENFNNMIFGIGLILLKRVQEWNH